jgi:hypothetical protein
VLRGPLCCLWCCVTQGMSKLTGLVHWPREPGHVQVDRVGIGLV